LRYPRQSERRASARLFALAKDNLNKKSIDAELAKTIIESQLLDGGNARQNLATFCQTKMEKQAVEIMSETLEKMQLTNPNIRRLLN
jgi:glutamate decarboxylase